MVESRFFPLFAALVVLLFFVHPLLTDAERQNVLLNLFTSVIFLVSLRTIASNRRMMVALILFALPLFGSRLWAQVSGDSVALLTYSAVHTVFLTAVMMVCLIRVLDSSPVTEDKILGAICVYLLIGVIFAFVYEMCYIVNPHSMDLGVDAGTGPDQFWNLSYFSFVTLTTLGYGDIQPVGRFVRAMATMEAIFGPLYLAILVARLVSVAQSFSSVRKKRHG